MSEGTDEKIEAQLTKYFQKVICNAGSNYYKKKFRHQSREQATEDVLNISKETTEFEEKFMEASILEEFIVNVFHLDGTSQNQGILSDREKSFLIEKFILEKTDKAISEDTGVTRQAITNMKHRIYKKIRKSSVPNLKL